MSNEEQEQAEVKQGQDPLMGTAMKVAPAIQEVLKAVAGDAMPQDKLAQASVHAARAVLQVLNVGINSKVIVPTLALVVNPSPTQEDLEGDPEPYKFGTLPIWISSTIPNFGDNVFLNAQIPVEWHPVMVRRTYYPYLGGHVLLTFKVFAKDKQEADMVWGMYKKFMQVEETDLTPRSKPEAEKEESPIVQPTGPKIIRP